MWTTACTEVREHLLFLMNVFTIESSDPTVTKKKETDQNFLLSSLEVLEISCF